MNVNKTTRLRSGKDVYVAAKISAISEEINAICEQSTFEKASFNESLSILEKSSAKSVLDSSFLLSAHNNVIGKVEHFTNSYATEIYEKIFKAAKPELKKLLEVYYLKYQIHNIVSTLRCVAHGLQDEVELYLIGNKVQKEHCIKASSYSYEEALRYFSTKFKFPKSLNEFNSIDSIMQLETALYKWYHEQLQQFLIETYKGSTLQIEHRKHIDILNTKIKKLGNLEEEFEAVDFFIKGGNLKLENIKDGDSSLEELDSMQKAFKSNIYQKTKNAPFASYVMILNFMQQLELNLQDLARMLKEKALSE